MYTMVMMMAVSSGGDAVAFGRNKGCDGGGCNGTVVVAAPVHGCTGSAAFGSGCTGNTWGGTSCTGNSCHGRSGFLGGRGGLFGKKGGCHGTTASCHGSAVVVGSCHGGHAAPAFGGSCFGSAPVAGCVPTVGVVGGAVMTPPVSMPKEPAKTTEPKKDEPKKEEKKQD